MGYIKLRTFCEEQMRLQDHLQKNLSFLLSEMMDTNSKRYLCHTRDDYEQLVLLLDRQVDEQKSNLEWICNHLNSIEQSLETMDSLFCWVSLDQYNCRYPEQQQSITLLNELHKDAFQNEVLLNLPSLRLNDDLFDTEDVESNLFDVEPAEVNEFTEDDRSSEKHLEKRRIAKCIVMRRCRQKRKEEKEALINENANLIQENDALMKENATLMSSLPQNKPELFAKSECFMSSDNRSSSEKNHEASSPRFFKEPYDNGSTLDEEAKKSHEQPPTQLKKSKKKLTPEQKLEAYRTRNIIGSAKNRQKNKQFLQDISQKIEQLKAEQAALKESNAHLKKLLEAASNEELGAEELFSYASAL